MKKRDEALIILAEECAEVIYIVSKSLRFGIDDIHPVTKIKNRDALVQELGDVAKMIDILIFQKVLTRKELGLAKLIKAKKLVQWSSL